jgi:1,4-dihydroxy-2-naphthoate octaprenyltransferase
MQRSRLGNFLAVVEIRTKVVSVSSFLLGTLFAMRCLSVQGIGAVHWGRALSMFLATLCVDMGTTAWNTYFDYLRGTDDPRINREPDKVLIHGGLPPAYAFWTAFWLYIAAMVGGLVLSFQVGFWILPVGAACMAVGFFYNAGPLPISHTPFGELFAGGFLGSGLFLISFGVQAAGRVGSGFKAAIGKGAALVDAGLMGAGQAGAVREGAGVLDVGLAGSGVGSVLREGAGLPAARWGEAAAALSGLPLSESLTLRGELWTLAVLASLPSLFAVAAILAVNNACDVEGDRLAGRKTFAVLFGKPAGEALALGLAHLAPLAGVVLSWIGVLPGMGMYAFPVSLLFTLYQFRRMHEIGFSHSTKSRNMKLILKVFGVWSVAYGGTLLLG